jgi:NADPH:quinone reductase-like Zn-dependent oxidoreductase
VQKLYPISETAPQNFETKGDTGPCFDGGNYPRKTVVLLFLKKGGVLVSLVQPPSDEKAKELSVRAALVASHPNGAQLAEIAKIIDSGKLAPVIDRILPICEARRAHKLSQSGHTHGKIALRVNNADGSLERKSS